MISVKGKIALVTGASRGIGAATAVELGRRGCSVAVNYLNSKALAEAVCAQIEAVGGKAFPVHGDVSTEAGVNEIYHSMQSLAGLPGILVNNAGEIIRPGEWDKAGTAEIQKNIDLNLVSTIRLVQKFAPEMQARGWGRIVNTTTTYAMTGAAGVLAYTAAKAGIISVTYALARELGRYGITVNAVAPGNIDTDMSKGAGVEFENWVNNTTPLGRLGRAEEIAEATAFLIGSEYITGHVLVVDGGHILNM